MDHILLEDPELARAFLLESDRQMSKLELIASENFVSSAVREAQGSVFTHKYAEGYPGKRYYGGCEFVDIAENLAIERAKQLFGCDYVNVQPHSGSQANMASYFALAKPGDTILGMNLSHGGHLTHGSPVNFSGRLFNVVSYGVDKDTCLINYEEVRRLAHEHRPTVIVAGASAYPRMTFEDLKNVVASLHEFNAATLDLDGLTQAIYQALDQTEAELKDLGTDMRSFAQGTPETDIPAPVPPRPAASAKPAAPSPEKPAERLRVKAKAQPVHHTAPAAPVHRLRNTRRPISQLLQDQIDKLGQEEQ